MRPNVELAEVSEILAEGSGGCFRKNTRVRVPKGWQHIQDFRVGDEVMCYDASRQLVEGKVTKFFRHSAGQPNLIITTEEKHVLLVTGNHWLLTERDTYAQASTFLVGDKLHTEQRKLTRIVSIEKDATVDTVYNLTVAPHYTFIVEGILAHNGGGDKGGVAYSGKEMEDTLVSTAYASVLDMLCEGEIEGLADIYGRTITDENDFGKAIYLDNTPLLSERNREYIQPLKHYIASERKYVLDHNRMWEAGERVMLYSADGEVSKAALIAALELFDRSVDANKDNLSWIMFRELHIEEDGEWIIITDPAFANGRMVLTGAVANFSQVKTAFSKGYPPQVEPLLIGFSKPRVVVPVNYEVTHNNPWRTDIIDAGAESVTITFRFPALVQQLKEDAWFVNTSYKSGDIIGTTVELSVWANGVHIQNIQISGKASSAYQRSMTLPVEHLPVRGTPWTLEVRRETPDSVQMALSNKSFVDYYMVNNEEQYLYPNIAKIGIQVAADRFPSVPTRMYHVKGIKVKIPKGYDPRRRTYSEKYWKGDFEPIKAWTTNPVWQFYDMCTNPRYGLGRFIEEAHINKWELYQCSKYCDELIDTGRTRHIETGTIWEDDTEILLLEPLRGYIRAGTIVTVNGFDMWEDRSYLVVQDAAPQDIRLAIAPATINVGHDEKRPVLTYPVWEPRFECSVYYQTFAEAWQAMRDMVSVFRAAIFWSDGYVNVSQDRPVAGEHQLFTPANVQNGEFTYMGGDLNNMYTRVNVRWNDPDHYDKPANVSVENIEGILRYGDRSTTVAAIGCRSVTQAQRLGFWLSFTNLYESEMVSFVTGQEGLYTFPGKVIAIQDSTRHSVQAGGRLRHMTVIDADTVELVLDRDVSLKAGHAYTLLVAAPADYRSAEEVSTEQQSDEVYKGYVTRVDLSEVTVDDTTDRITVPSFLEDSSQDAQGWVWALEDASAAEETLWRVMKVTPGQAGEVGIEAKRYYPKKFADIDKAVFSYRPARPGTPDLDPVPPRFFTARQVFAFSPSAPLAQVFLSWSAPENAAVLGYDLAFVDINNINQINIFARNVKGQTYTAELTRNAERFLIRSISFAGKTSEWVRATVERSTVSLQELAPVTGLAFADGRDDGRFETPDVSFQWRLNNSLGPEFTDANVGASVGGNSPLFKDYVVRIRRVDGSIAREHYTVERSVWYPFFQNDLDNISGPHPEFHMEVRLRDVDGNMSLPAVMHCINLPPVQCTDLTLVRGGQGLSATWSAPPGARDIAQYYVYVTLSADTPDLTKPPTRVVSATQFTWREERNHETWGTHVRKYFFVRARDWFLQLGEAAGPASVDPLPKFDSGSMVLTPVPSNQGGLAIKLTWTPVAGNDRLRVAVRRSDLSADSETEHEGAYSAGELLIRFGLEDAEHAFRFRIWRVYVFDDFQADGPDYIPVDYEVQHDAKPPGPVDSLSGSFNTTLNAFELSWTNPYDADFVAVRIEARYGEAGSFRHLTTLAPLQPGVSASYVDYGLMRGPQDYDAYYRLYDEDVSGNQSSVSEESGTVVKIPAPVGVSASVPSGFYRKFRVTWTNDPNAGSDWLAISYHPTASPSEVSMLWVPYKDNQADIEVPFIGQVDVTTWRVTTIRGISINSAVTTAVNTTVLEYPATSVTSLAASYDAGAKAVYVTWSEPLVTWYQNAIVYRRVGATGDFIQVASVNKGALPRFIDRDIVRGPADETMYYQVYAYNIAGVESSSPAEADAVVPKIAAPAGFAVVAASVPFNYHATWTNDPNAGDDWMVIQYWSNDKPEEIFVAQTPYKDNEAIIGATFATVNVRVRAWRMMVVRGVQWISEATSVLSVTVSDYPTYEGTISGPAYDSATHRISMTINVPSDRSHKESIISRRLGTSGDMLEHAVIPRGAGSAYVDDDVYPSDTDRTYQYEVRHINASGQTAGAQNSVSVSVPKISALSNTTAQPDAAISRQVNITWTSGVSGEDVEISYFQLGSPATAKTARVPASDNGATIRLDFAGTVSLHLRRIVYIRNIECKGLAISTLVLSEDRIPLSATAISVEQMLDRVRISWTLPATMVDCTGWALHRAYLREHRLRQPYESGSVTWESVAIVPPAQTFGEDRGPFGDVADETRTYAYRVVPIDRTGVEITDNSLNTLTAHPSGLSVLVPGVCYADSAYASHAAQAVSDEYDVIQLGIALPWTTGQPISFSSTGTLPGGLAAGRLYYAVTSPWTNDYWFYVYAEINDTAPIDITSAGTGTLTVHMHTYTIDSYSDIFEPVTGTGFELDTGHALVTGDWVQLFAYNSGVEGTVPSPFVKAVPYYVTRHSAYVVLLSEGPGMPTIVPSNVGVGNIKLVRCNFTLPVPAGRAKDYLDHYRFTLRRFGGDFVNISAEFEEDNVLTGSLRVTPNYAAGTYSLNLPTIRAMSPFMRYGRTYYGRWNYITS